MTSWSDRGIYRKCYLNFTLIYFPKMLQRERSMLRIPIHTFRCLTSSNIVGNIFYHVIIRIFFVTLFYMT